MKRQYPIPLSHGRQANVTGNTVSFFFPRPSIKSIREIWFADEWAAHRDIVRFARFEDLSQGFHVFVATHQDDRDFLESSFSIVDRNSLFTSQVEMNWICKLVFNIGMFWSKLRI